MKKFWIQVAILLIIIFGAFYFYSNQGLLAPAIPSIQPTLEKKTVRINDTQIKVEMAKDVNSRKLGLGGRDSLAPDSGMLFVYPQESVYKFWMKGMNIPLDFIFIRDGEVVDILRNIQPPTANQDDVTLPIYQPIEPIDTLLEVNAGFIDSQNIKVGDKVYLVER